MTCIAAVVDKGRIIMGADSAGVGAGYGLTIRADRKVFRNGEFVMGFTSSFRMGQLLAFALNPPKPREGVDLFAYMVTDFVDSVRDCLKRGGFAERVNEAERTGQFLVGCRGRLFSIDVDYQVGEAASGFASVGCADMIALGCLAAMKDLDGEIRVRRALEIAESLSAGVRGPFVFEALEATAPQ